MENMSRNIDGKRIIDKLCNILLKRFNKKKIICFGDSHRSVFNNVGKIETINVGSGTAYNLNRDDSLTKSGKKIKDELKKRIPKEDIILLTFGEIDCMEHIYKNRFRTNKDVTKIVEEIIDRYIKFINYVTNKGFTCLIYGPAFSGRAFNSYGRIKDRNKAIQ